MPMRREVPKEKNSDQSNSAHSTKDSCPFSKDLNIPQRQSQPNEKQARERPLSTLLPKSTTQYTNTISSNSNNNISAAAAIASNSTSTSTSTSTLTSSSATTTIAAGAGTSNPVPPTQTQIDIVRYTWERVTEIRHSTDDPLISPPHAFGFALYKALFDLDNDLRLVFPNVLQQARALAGMIAYIVRAPAVTFAERNPLQCCANASEENKPGVGGSRGLPLVCIHGNRRQQPTPTIQAINARKRANQMTATTDSPSFSDVVTQAAAANACPASASASASASFSATQANKCSGSVEARGGGIDDEGLDPEWLGQRLRRLGARHYGYNVEPHHIAYMGPAVIRVLKERLRDEFLPEVEDAWQTTHAFAAHHMKIGLEAQKASEEESQNNHRQSRGPRATCCIQ